MLRRPKPNPLLDVAIDDLLEQLPAEEVGSDRYAKIMNELTRLYKFKEMQTPKPVSLDTLILVAGNIVGIILILGHERANVVTAKGVGVVRRPK